MTTDRTRRHALVARVTDNPASAFVFYADIFKTTEANFWYYGKYSNQSIRRDTHSVKFFASEELAKAELREIELASGKEECDRLKQEHTKAVDTYRANMAEAVSGWANGVEDA